LNRAIQVDPTFVFAYQLRGDVYRNLGKFEASLSDFEIAEKLQPNDYFTISRR